MQLNYQIVNVFTENGGKLTGNPLCVFENARGLSSEQMQALALQFNLSETTFIFPSAIANARVRIFAPTYEMPFAGHPTLGTAHVVRKLGAAGDDVTLELNVGVIPVQAQGGTWELRANTATSRAPAASQADIARALGLEENDVRGPALWVNSGAEQLIVPLISADAVRRVKPSFESLRCATQDGVRPTAYVFAPTGTDTLVARFFFSKVESLMEDPATGSATANLGGWFLATRHLAQFALPTAKVISQGAMIGRPSTLRLRIDAERRVFVAGEVIELAHGRLEL